MKEVENGYYSGESDGEEDEENETNGLMIDMKNGCETEMTLGGNDEVDGDVCQNLMKRFNDERMMNGLRESRLSGLGVIIFSGGKSL
jgi:hypothetical protein